MDPKKIAQLLHLLHIPLAILLIPLAPLWLPFGYALLTALLIVVIQSLCDACPWLLLVNHYRQQAGLPQLLGLTERLYHAIGSLTAPVSAVAYVGSVFLIRYLVLQLGLPTPLWATP